MSSSLCGWLVVLQLWGALPDGEWETLGGEKITGKTARLTTNEVQVATTEGNREVKIADVLRFQAKEDEGGGERTASSGEARLIDGSRFGFDAAAHAGGEEFLEFQSARLGTFRLPTARVASLRLQKEDRRLSESWGEMLSRAGRDDRLVIRKEEVLDFLEGVIGEIGPQGIKFLLDSEEHEVKSERVYGVIYAREPAVPQEGCLVLLRGGDRFVCEGVGLEGEACVLALAGGAELRVPSEGVREFDYSFGKVQFLSELEPRSVKYTPMFNVTWQYRRDKSLDGNALRLNRKSFTRGLAIHSKTELTYRLPSGYRQFRAVMGIDDEITRTGGDVIVLIEGVNAEGGVRELLNSRVQLNQPPQPIDLDITGWQDLRITVDFGEGLDIGDHLDLAEARIIR